MLNLREVVRQRVRAYVGIAGRIAASSLALVLAKLSDLVAKRRSRSRSNPATAPADGSGS